MGDISGILSILFVISGLIYIFYFRPKFEEKQNHLIFDNRVLGFIDGLSFSGINFGCADFEMRSYVEEQLSKAHSLPGNQFLIEYTTANGFVFRSHTCKNDHFLFSILCIAQYAKEHGNSELVSWCESKMILASKSGIYY